MNRREDGASTRRALLGAARKLFAAKGFHDTTVSEIVEAAGASQAAVNYYFGSKESLYGEVWREAFAEASERYPFDGGVPASAPPERRLYGLIDGLLSRLLRQREHNESGQLLLQELSRPVEAIRELRRRSTQPIRELAHEIVADLLGPDARDEDVRHCVTSVLHQCLAIGFRGGRKPPSLGQGRFREPEIQALVEHVHTFSLGGIGAVRERIQAGNERGAAPQSSTGEQS